MINYPNFRTYGKPPYEVGLIHGGPGAPGELAPLAEKVSHYKSVIEPLQKGFSLDAVIQELKETLLTEAHPPVILVGWSWGAMLSLLFTSRHPHLVKKLILINSGPLSEKYVERIASTREKRLSASMKAEIDDLGKRLKDPVEADKKEILKRFAHLIFKADGYAYSTEDSPCLDCPPELHTKVWEEASIFRKKGLFEQALKSIQCPITVIQGDYDPRPFEGVTEPLSSAGKNCRCILLEQCGHYPWFEKHADAKFQQILYNEINNLL